MTILLAVAVGDLVVVMAEKIVPLRDNLALAVSGAKVAADMAEADLQKFAPALAPHVLSQLKRLAFAGASYVTSGEAKVALLAAGFDVHGAYIAAARYEAGMNQPEALLSRALGNVAFTVLGGEDAGTQARFAEKLSTMFPEGKPAVERAGLPAALLNAGQETIGAPVDSRVMWRGQPAT